MADSDSIDKQTVTKVSRMPKAGFNVHPENINREGRPKRKTLTELIHAKLDDTPEGWDKLVALVIYKLFQDKDKDILKTLWNYTDGMPKQKVEIDDPRKRIEEMKKYIDDKIQPVDSDVPLEPEE